MKGVRVAKTFKSKEEGRQWAAAQEASILAAENGQFPPKTLGEAMDRYVQDVSSKKAGERYETVKFIAFKRDFPGLAARIISKVDTSHLVEWRDARLKVVSKGSVQREVNLYRNLFSIARDEWKWCGHSPFKGMRMPGDNPARERRVQPSEVRRICRWLGYRTGIVVTKYQEVALAFLIALRTGMRSGEILVLSDARVDFEGRVATVPHKTQHLTGKPRKIPLTRHAVRLMSVLRGRDQWFTINDADRDVIFRKARDACLIQGLTFHDSRAEALTRFSKKVDVMTLARISGHKDLKVLMEHYYRESAEDIAGRLDLPRM